MVQRPFTKSYRLEHAGVLLDIRFCDNHSREESKLEARATDILSQQIYRRKLHSQAVADPRNGLVDRDLK